MPSLTATGCSIALFTLVSTVPAFPQGNERASLSSSGAQIYQPNRSPDVSASGDIVTFYSPARHLVVGDTNGTFDVFAHNRKTRNTRRMSLSSAGSQGNDTSYAARISGNGRFVAFTSLASNLVPGDGNGRSDIFVRDRQTGVTERVSVSSAGLEANGISYYPAISGDGRYVTFLSAASNLVSGDTNGATDVFVHDRTTGVTSRVDVSSSGAEANGGCRFAAISADGRHVAFQSFASNLVAGDSNGVEDVFVHNLDSSVTARVSVNAEGLDANDRSINPSISGDGRFIAFQSFASNIVANDHNATEDVFVRDMERGTSERVSVNSAGQESAMYLSSSMPAISTNGRFVAFQSIATNFVANDGNRTQDIFLRDRKLSTTRRVSVATDGGDPNGYSENPAINADGSVVVFESLASNLVPNDTNGRRDIFVAEGGTTTSTRKIAKAQR